MANHNIQEESKILDRAMATSLGSLIGLEIRKHLLDPTDNDDLMVSVCNNDFPEFRNFNSFVFLFFFSTSFFFLHFKIFFWYYFLGGPGDSETKEDFAHWKALFF